METAIKLVVVGDGAVGKTSLLISYSMNSFPEVKYDTKSRKITYQQFLTIISAIYCIINKLLLSHFGIQEDYDRLRPLSYPETNVFLVCFSLENPSSLSNVQFKWIPEISKFCPDIPFILVGTKLDLREGDETTLKRLQERGTCPVTQEEGRKMSEKIGAYDYCECSARTQKGMKHVFEVAVKAAMECMEKERFKKEKLFKRKNKIGCQIL